MPGVTIYLPDELYIEVKKEADKAGTNISEVLQKAAKKYLDQLKKQTHRSSEAETDQKGKEAS